MSRKLDMFAPGVFNANIRKVERYSFTLVAKEVIDEIFVAESKIAVDLWPINMTTNVNTEDTVIITDINVEGFEGNLLVQEVDAYRYSFKYKMLVRDEFLRQHRLLGAPYEVIDRYLDDHEIEIPDPTRVEFPVFRKDTPVTVHGIFNKKLDFQFFIMFMGAAQVVEP